MPQRDDVRVAMVLPDRERCGIADYVGYLTEGLARVGVDCDVIDPRRMATLQDGVDLVHVQHQYFFYGGVAPWKNWFRTFVREIERPCVMTVHEFVSPAGKPHVRAALRITNRLQFGSRKIARLLVHTDEDRRRMIAAGFDSGRLTVVRHGVPRRPDLPDKQIAKRALGQDGRFVVTIFGFLSRKKGHGVALEAMREAPEGTQLLIAGGAHPDDKSDYPRLLESMIDSMGLRDRVRITGYLEPDEVNTVMAATDLVAAPFTETSGSGSLALAFACGKAVVASDIPPHREIVGEEPDALRLTKADPAQLARAITELRSAPDELARLGRGAQRYAAAHTYDRMAEETLAVYHDVLRGLPR